jgi:hypothetical protein
MAERSQITLHAAAPAKPGFGESCSGCGACCALETCPPGRVVFLRAGGPCPALRWKVSALRYRCGLVDAPGDYLRWLPQWGRRVVSRLTLRAIAAGTGCDFDAAVE